MQRRQGLRTGRGSFQDMVDTVDTSICQTGHPQNNTFLCPVPHLLGARSIVQPQFVMPRWVWRFRGGTCSSCGRHRLLGLSLTPVGLKPDKAGHVPEWQPPVTHERRNPNHSRWIVWLHMENDRPRCFPAGLFPTQCGLQRAVLSDSASSLIYQ